MANNLGYTTNTRDVDIVVFLDIIKGDIKKLIRKYGHRNCGLRQEDLCEEIKKVIPQKKKIVFEIMDIHGKKKWGNDWNRVRNGFLNKLYEEEGFINMCFPKKYTKNPSLDQLLLKHIDFCKKKDERRATLEKTSEYSECVNYNSWIETERKSFTMEYLRNVSNFKSQTVNKYFSTKKHPSGHDPRETYQRSKLDCEIYNPTSNRYQKKTVEKALKNKPQPPRVPNIIRVSQGKDERTATDKDSESAKTKPEENTFPKPKPRTPDSRIPSPSKTQIVGTSTVQDTPVKTKDLGSPVNKKGEKEGETSIKSVPPTNDPPTAQAVPPHAKSSPLSPKDTIPKTATQSVPLPTITTSLFSTPTTVENVTLRQTTVTSPSLTITSNSSLKSGIPSLTDQHPPPLPPATEGHDNVSHTTPGTSSDTHAITHPAISVPSTTPVDSSLSQLQVPVLNASPVVTAPEVLGTPASSSASTITTTFTTTTASTATVTIPTMSTMQNPISSTNEASRILNIPEPPPYQAPSGSKVAAPATDPQQTPLSSPTPRAGNPTPPVKVQTDRDTEAKSTSDLLSKPKNSIQVPGTQLSKDTNQASRHPSITSGTIPDNNVQKKPHQIDQQNNTSAVQHPPNTGVVLPPYDKSGDTVKTVKVNTKAISRDDSTVRTNKNDNPNIIPEGIPPLTHIIPTFLDLKRIFEIPEKPTYEYPNITVHEWEHPNLVKQRGKNNVYIKLLKINRYKQEIQKRKKKKKTTLIEVHMEIFEEYKKDEWELHKGDFLEICLLGFVNEENDAYSKLPNSELSVNNIKNEKTIEDIQKHKILWNNWIENHRNILEQWKKEAWFQILKNKWRNEEQIYKEKNNKLQENMLNEQETYSIVSQKEIWKQWISKQATLIDMFNKEDWFKSMVYAQNKEKDNYHINEYNNISVTSKTGLKNEKMNHEQGRSKNIIQKLMVQIHMMVLEECIKEDIMKNKEISIDNYIKCINDKNNYEQKSYIPECASDGFNVSEFKEINTYVNK
ncbi:STP1 protein [Plasmodium ovale]|uniref:STP1 protein n=1 Tax=Plasmodium ovale TaxID=36330 RepID=A0A1D3JG13_PLAOA|nr:STP1 protein [Plasmodium ovale]